MEKFATHVTLDEAEAMGPPPEGNLAIPVFDHGTMQAELYIPDGEDRQSPHSRDEIYFVARGSGRFFNGLERVAVAQGSFIFVPAGVTHRFEDSTKDFSVWVVFYGPEGGER
jgi:mannose-6-phosphate isomerase-like protein (cupin superfamily)